MKEPIVLVALESARLSKEGIFDFLFGKKKEDETPSMKRLEKLEAEAKQLKAGPGLDVLSGKVKPDQPLLDKLLSITENHQAPSQVYKQNAQLFSTLCKLVALPEPYPYGVNEDLENAETDREAEKILRDYIKLMGPQVKLCRSVNKGLVVGPAIVEELFEDVTKRYVENWAFIKRYCYDRPDQYSTYEAAIHTQDFGYIVGTLGNCDSPGVEALKEKNETVFDKLEDAVQDIDDAVSEFNYLWQFKRGGKSFSYFIPSHDDVEFLVHARCALLDYVLKLKVSKEDLERADLLEGIKVASEAVSDLTVLSTALEAASSDSNFGQYNLSLYSNQVNAVCRKLQVVPMNLSVESLGTSAEAVSNLLSVVQSALVDLQKKVS